MLDLAQLRTNIQEKQAELRKAIEQYKLASQAELIPWAPSLDFLHLNNCRVLPSREHILDLLPKNSICAEIGTQYGNFAKSIIDRTQPREFHIIDIDFSLFHGNFFESEKLLKIMKLHKGDSSTILQKFPDKYFDWIYIDGDHSYSGFIKDLYVSSRKVRNNGLIICNDYTTWSPAEVCEYGVLRGLNEFCIRYNWEFIYIGLHGQGYHDICIKKI